MLALAVGVHLTLRARPLRRRDVANRRQFLRVATFGAGAVALWQVQRPVQRLFDMRAAKRRFTGSYEEGSFSGNAFPATSWVADSPRELDGSSYRLRVSGLVAHELELAAGELTRAMRSRQRSTAPAAGTRGRTGAASRSRR